MVELNLTFTYTSYCHGIVDEMFQGDVGVPLDDSSDADVLPL